jgi:hypothetical protein
LGRASKRGRRRGEGEVGGGGLIGIKQYLN